MLRVVVEFDEAMSTAILSFDSRLLKDDIESSQALCSIPEGSIFESLIADDWMLCVGSGVENSSVAAIYVVRSWWGRVLVVILLAIGLQFQSRSRCGTR